MQTNPGVIEQYERRQAEVCSTSVVILRRILTRVQIAKLTKTLNERENAKQRLEGGIKSARVRHPLARLSGVLTGWIGQLGTCPRKACGKYWKEVFCCIRP